MGYTLKAVSTISYSEKVSTRTVSSTWRQTLRHARETEGPGSIAPTVTLPAPFARPLPASQAAQDAI